MVARLSDLAPLSSFKQTGHPVQIFIYLLMLQVQMDRVLSGMGVDCKLDGPHSKAESLP